MMHGQQNIKITITQPVTKFHVPLEPEVALLFSLQPAICTYKLD
jgi:hypothetical protein